MLNLLPVNTILLCRFALIVINLKVLQLQFILLMLSPVIPRTIPDIILNKDRLSV